MPSDLTPAEKEDKEAVRLIHKRPAPSRKSRPRRAPKHDNRRERMRTGDPDLDGRDKDMSLNFKDVGSSLVDMALFVAANEATSNDPGWAEAMSSRIAQYHGVLQQGHPSGPTNTGYRSVDKRYFTKDHCDAIVSAAKDLLSGEDWLKHDFDLVESDAKFRAALDLAIYAADGSLFQSKVDAGTYEALLARLVGSDEDLFSNTFLGKTKKAAAMNEHIQNIVRVADGIRRSHPKAAVEIMRNVQKLAQEQSFFQQGQQQQGQQQQGQQQQGQQQQGQQQQQQGQQQQDQQGQQQEQGMGKKFNPKEIKNQLAEIKKSRDAEDLAEALGKLQETLHMSSRTAAAEFDLSAIEGMSDEEIQQLIASVESEVVNAERTVDEILGGDDLSTLSDKEVEDMIKGMDSLFKAIGEKAEQKTASCVSVSIPDLVRLATEVPEARQYLVSALAAAKKKVDKAKAKKKTSQEEQEGAKGKKAPGKKAPPFGGKKAPPFGGGKGKGKGKGKVPAFLKSKKGKKASVQVTKADLIW